MKTNNWFEVDKKGLAELQAGKPAWYIIRELVQNAWDEQITLCDVQIMQTGKTITIIVADDSPEGFKDITHAYTLFATTDKRSNAIQRGRFNLGEKQVLALAAEACIATTKGTIIFDNKGRHKSKKRLDYGSKITVNIRATNNEYQEILSMAKEFLPPPNIRYIVNDVVIASKSPDFAQEVSLQTELLIGDKIRKVTRPTIIELYLGAWLYEMGLPICPLQCPYLVNVQQKIPLSPDRETVSEAYLQAIYAEVLNITKEKITPEASSEVWIREASANARVSKEALNTVIKQRYGGKVLVANTFDKRSIDEAITHGYKLIYGSELSSGEWQNIKRDNLMQSTTDIFGTSFVPAQPYHPNKEMLAFAQFAERAAWRLCEVNIHVEFVTFSGVAAQYANQVLTINVQAVGEQFFQPPISGRTIDLLLHELGHIYGQHHEHAYQEAITRMAGQLVMIALEEPNFFKK